MLMSTVATMAVGFGLGLMHALDADHVMAVSVLSNNSVGCHHEDNKNLGGKKLFKSMFSNGNRLPLLFCVHWALGHSSVLIISGLLLFGFGLSIPNSLQQGAEIFVGILLIVLGIVCCWAIKQQQWRLVKHSHDGVTHCHWHVKGDVRRNGHGRENSGHTPVMVGIVHGLAGSAPALALVPAIAQGNILAALGYLLVFSIGVLLSMLVFGMGFGALQGYWQQQSTQLFSRYRYFIASCSIIVGSYWLVQAI